VTKSEYKIVPRVQTTRRHAGIFFVCGEALKEWRSSSICMIFCSFFSSTTPNSQSTQSERTHLDIVKEFLGKVDIFNTSMSLGGLNSNYCPGRSEFQFTGSVSAFTSTRCNNVGSLWRIKGLYNAQRSKWKR
jgi:hypothetical protein